MTADGYTFTMLGDSLGITRQAARQRFGPKPSGPMAHYYTGRP